LLAANATASTNVPTLGVRLLIRISFKMILHQNHFDAYLFP
jgi:hypothetical protein